MRPAGDECLPVVSSAFAFDAFELRSRRRVVEFRVLYCPGHSFSVQRWIKDRGLSPGLPEFAVVVSISENKGFGNGAVCAGLRLGPFHGGNTGSSPVGRATAHRIKTSKGAARNRRPS